jgi:hypothetical protein
VRSFYALRRWRHLQQPFIFNEEISCCVLAVPTLKRSETEEALTDQANTLEIKISFMLQREPVGKNKNLSF